MTCDQPADLVVIRRSTYERQPQLAVVLRTRCGMKDHPVRDLDNPSDTVPHVERRHIESWVQAGLVPSLEGTLSGAFQECERYNRIPLPFCELQQRIGCLRYLATDRNNIRLLRT